MKARPLEGKGYEPMKKFISVITSITFTAAAVGQCWALGLGELRVYTYLNEPLIAQIDLLEADDLSEGEMQVGIATDAEFTRLGMIRDVFLTRINFVVELDAAGKRVVLSTDAPLREPYLDLIVEARWPDGRLLRDYTVLVDLPPRAMEVPPVGSEVGVGWSATVADTAWGDLGADREYYRSALDEPISGGRYLTTSFDTLWRIASGIAQQSVSVQQVMLEIVATNPDAFVDGNVNGLKSGYVLRLPDVEAFNGDSARARAETERQNEAWAGVVIGGSGGLRLVADVEIDDPPTSDVIEAESEPVTARSLPDSPSLEVNDQNAADALASAGGDEDIAVPDPWRLDALMEAVGRLDSSVAQLQRRLAERDAEIAELRAELASQAATTATGQSPVGIEPVEQTAQAKSWSLEPSWVLPAGAGLGMAVLWALMRIGRRHRAAVMRADQTLPVLEAEEVTDVSSTASADLRVGRDAGDLDTFDDHQDSGGVTEKFGGAEQIEDADVQRASETAITQQVSEAPGSDGAGMDPARDSSPTLEFWEGDSADTPRFAPARSGMTLQPLEGTPGVPRGETDSAEASIYGAETDPIDSKLDLARAYIEMGDDDGARPVLLEAIQQGGLGQQAEARELLRRIEGS